ncbi:UDP-N-acetylmuramoyl-L-alanyl-D-glutamate--2,6-diaminopimelate ligase [Cucumibacter marinus]|uniref:UDP-N-acetylmuramoyl-L-alanyl-D-glutamate--2, 6-diaminopimelate ligase n=1 Tax=Cucumibacter marinus TaxID=1121252 RepID=UPI0004107FF9|nr:UDP-N-acetylmuramoyl-L-alanyl-D-glutamate--2,6-diaminopimelate ligase [Cucumibacter marinus]
MSFELADILAEDDKKQVPKGLHVTGIRAQSSHVAPGEAFFALPGTRVHGNQFIADAVENGAAMIVTDHKPDIEPVVPVVVVEDVRAAYARAAASLFAPQPEISAAVTGTSGKTSVVNFLRQFWAHAGIKAASVGTLGVIVEGEEMMGGSTGDLTTPDALDLHHQLRNLKTLYDVDHVALEASSHGLDQRRLDGLAFDAVGFTNLSHEHLDYHGEMAAYRDAKMRLFRDLLKEGGTAVVNCDDAEHPPFMFAALERGATLMTVGREGAHFEVGEVIREGFGQRVTGKLVGEDVSFHLPLTGEFQVSNAVVAGAMAMATGVEKEAMIEGMSALRGAKGRLEHVADHNGGGIFVDYSHKPAALQSALESLRPYVDGRLIVVFGAGGDRDKGKRPIMGQIATQLADAVIVTDDNPRSEDPAEIRKEILAEAPAAREVGDRADAIALGIGDMRKGDVLLIAGKGHEDYQIVGSTKHHFSDHEVVAQAVSAQRAAG